MAKKQFKCYMHGENSDSQYYNHENELELDENSENYKKNFHRFNYEVELNMEVDTETYKVQIIGVHGVKLEKPVDC